MSGMNRGRFVYRRSGVVHEGRGWWMMSWSNDAHGNGEMRDTATLIRMRFRGRGRRKALDFWKGRSSGGGFALMSISATFGRAAR